MKGLKEMVAATSSSEPAPVTMSGEAQRAYALKMRQWSGWPNAQIQWRKPTGGSPYASCNHITHTFEINPDTLVLNPHRVLNTITPFRLKQEAVLTGAMLHEASHARHTHWKPGRYGNPMELLHPDGTPVTKQTLGLASLLEEARIEGLMARDADENGATGLAWTLRACAAYVVPATTLSADPEQKLMDLLTSWAQRAGRAIAFNFTTSHPMSPWVQAMTSLLSKHVEQHLTEQGTEDPGARTREVMDNLLSMARGTVNGMFSDGSESDSGTFMVDRARRVLEILFPETDGDSEGAPMPGSGCGEPETGDGDEGEEGEDASASSSSDGEDEDPDADSDADADTDSEVAQQLAELEAQAKSDAEAEAESAEKSTEPSMGVSTRGEDGRFGSGWRQPTKEEREIQKGAERFLRSLIEPTESSHTYITDTPSSQINGAAHAQWLAGGMRRAPHFFTRTRRAVEPSPPVKIAVLVDVSGSMEQLQAPSAVLSWALSSAARDLQNFAGRGQQIESCLIHWGSGARVIQGNGQPLPGIREYPCVEGTYAMGEALNLVEQEMPGFFDTTETPANRLLVQFTDWEMGDPGGVAALRLGQALGSGVNMVTVAPENYTNRWSVLNSLLASIKVQRGRSSLMKYNPMFPAQVWDFSAEMLR